MSFRAQRGLCGWAVFLLAAASAARAQGAGTVTGVVLDDDRRPVSGATVMAMRGDTAVREAITAADGAFRLAPLAPGVYTVAARKLGHRSAEQPRIRVAEGQTVTLTVLLTRTARQLSTIEVVSSPTAVDATTPALTVHLDRTFTQLLPSARTASSLVTLVPGARKDQLWGGAPGVSNDYQLDGVSMNHPGIGGDFLALSVDWIESLDIRGLGAGAEHGDFQGGVINAITKTGTNRRAATLRSNYESPSLTATNFELDEQGVEQAGRREIAGEALGPIARDRVFYFVAGQYVARELRSPDLATAPGRDFQATREAQRDARGIGKITWLPALGQRLDLLAGFSSADIGHAGINGIDLASGTQRVSKPTTYAGITWSNHRSARSQVDLRLAGFTSRETRRGYGGLNVPGVQLFTSGRMPRWQNPAFDERREPSSLSGTIEWRTRARLLAEHELSIGAERTMGRWRDQRTRNGGMTWRPYFSGASTFDRFNAATWPDAASEWGGDTFIDSDMSNSALYLQDRVSLGSRVTLEPGVRWGSWSGFIRPREDCARAPMCYRFEAVRASGIAPRIGLAWDVTGQSTLAVKAHWGRYHQGMFALFFDRAEGADVYTNQRFYYTAPDITDATTTFTVTQRNAPGSGFTSFDETIMNTAGRVEGYRQPFVDQTVLAVEKSIGRGWKAEVTVTSRVNKDIVGLLDRNRETNYTPVTNVHVDNRFVNGVVLDAEGNRLVLTRVWASNLALLQALDAVRSAARPGGSRIAGLDTAGIARLTWNPDVVLATIPDARRRYEQATVMLRANYPALRAEGSFSWARLKGNVPGVAGYGTAATRFTAGPFVNPNEGLNSFGLLPDALEWEGKLWLTARLPWSMQGGFVFTHTYGERFTPSFELQGRYLYSLDDRSPLPAELFASSFGQAILIEARGDRHFASRDVVDAHLEWRAPKWANAFVAEADLFNVFGASALLAIKTTVDDQSPLDPTSRFGAPRLRVQPRALRLGLRMTAH